MRWIRAGFALVGVLLLGAVVVTSTALDGPTTRLIARLGSDYLVVSTVGMAAILAAAVVALTERTGPHRRTDLPDPENPISAPSPGDSIDEILMRPTVRWPSIGHNPRTDVRARLREAVIDALARADACDRPRAVERIEDGTWTDDERAAEFLRTAETRTYSRLRDLIGGRVRFEAGVDRTLSAISEVGTRAGSTVERPIGAQARLGSPSTEDDA